MDTHDFLIVGQGISGTALAQQLHLRKKTFMVLDKVDANQASRIASGIWNPLTLKRMKKSWLADEMLAEILPFYRQAENLFKDTFIDDVKVVRLFAAAEETNDWIEKSDNPLYEELLNPIILKNTNPQIESKFGFGEVAISGRINTEKWLDAARRWLLTKNAMREESFDFSKLVLNQDGISYKNITARGIIFCEGMHAAFHNPYFKHIPFILTKGEVLEIKCLDLNLKNIINSGVFILPLGDNHYKIGATYDWDNLDVVPTQTARNEMTDKLKKFMTAPFEIVSQSTGIRPTTKDRRPLLGTHPKHPQIQIFNGMGSRGVFMLPYLSNMMVGHLLDAKPLHKEADIKRFEKLLSA